MPQKLFLIRHGKPWFPTEERYCLGGRTDWPLGEEGKEQSRKMAEELFHRLGEKTSVEIWSSPLVRATQTASFLCRNGEKPRIQALLREMDAGEWDGKSFSWIQKEYPEEYGARKGRQGMSLIPGAESDEAGLARFQKGVAEILSESRAENIVLVAHATVIQLFCCFLAGRPLQESRNFKPEYAEITELDAEEIRKKLGTGRAAEGPADTDESHKESSEDRNKKTQEYLYASPVGVLRLRAEGDCLTGLAFPGETVKTYYRNGKKESVSGDFRKEIVFAGREPAAKTPGGPVSPVLEETVRWLDRYFAGIDPGPCPKMKITGTPFHCLVGEIMQGIPYGQSMTYGEIAKIAAGRMKKEKMSAQAVGGAVGSNAIGILIPCHRVLGAGGKLTGFGGGIPAKKYLLDLEKIPYLNRIRHAARKEKY